MSSHEFDLTPLLDATDDEDSGEDTGMLITSVQREGGNPYQSFAVYIHRKHSRLVKRVQQLEKKIDRAMWLISGAVFVGGAAWKLLEFLFSHFGK